jgi:hypothetical protein
VSLESKTKTALWIYNEFYYANGVNQESKWVPLEEAQTLVDVLALTKKSLEETEKEHTEMRLKIQEANKALDNFEAEISDQVFECYGNYIIMKEDWRTAVQAFREVLSK